MYARAREHAYKAQRVGLVFNKYENPVIWFVPTLINGFEELKSKRLNSSVNYAWRSSRSIFTGFRGTDVFYLKAPESAYAAIKCGTSDKRSDTGDEERDCGSAGVAVPRPPRCEPALASNRLELQKWWGSERDVENWLFWKLPKLDGKGSAALCRLTGGGHLMSL